MSRLAGRLLGLALPACAAAGAEGLPMPVPMAPIVRPRTPNTALAAPAGFSPEPDVLTRPGTADPASLYRRAVAVATGWPRSFLQARFDDAREVHVVVRSALCNFPDLVMVRVADDAGVIIWSRSVYGHSDMGVNRRRVAAWVVALDVAGSVG